MDNTVPSYTFTTMSNFNFLNRTTKTLFDFGNRDIVEYNINELLIFYITKNMLLLNRNITELYKNTKIFLTPCECKKVLYVFRRVLIIKHFINKMVYRVLHNKEWKKINQNDLYLSDFKVEDNNLIEVRDYFNKSIYTFRIHEILSIYKNSLFNNGLDGEEDGQILPSPCYPKNPYTNIRFTLRQHIDIYRLLLSIFCKKLKNLPEYYLLFKNSYFDIKRFNRKYNIYLYYSAAYKYTQSLSDMEWNHHIYIYMGRNPSFCYTCFKSKYAVRSIFNESLILFILNDNHIYNYGYGDTLWKQTAIEHDLWFDSNHRISHRRILRARRTPMTSIMNNNQNE